MTTTILIVPAWSDQAGQCRIVATNGLGKLDPLKDYRERPNCWTDVGLMNSRGQLVCFDGPKHQRQELVDCQPLMAGTTFTFEE